MTIQEGTMGKLISMITGYWAKPVAESVQKKKRISALPKTRQKGLQFPHSLLLLLIIQPSEIIIFLFTTGLLGLCIGLALRLFKKRAVVVAFAALSLTVGIAVLLYGFRFPVLGPLISSDFRLTTSAIIYAFSFIYSWLWVEISIANLRFLARALL